MKLFFLAVLIPLSLLCEESRIISYAGMSFSCDKGCGHPVSDWNMRKIDSLFIEYLNSTHEINFYLPTREGDWKRGPFWFFRWGPADCSYTAYNWRQEKGFWDSKVEYKDFSFATYSGFLQTANIFREDLYYFYQQTMHYYQEDIEKAKENISILKQLQRKGCRAVEIYDDGDISPTSIWNYNAAPIKDSIEYQEKRIVFAKEDILKIDAQYENLSSSAEETFRKMDEVFKKIFTWCLQNHQPEGIAFRESLEYFLQEDLYEALDRIRFLIELSEKQGHSSEWIAKLLFLQGQLQSEFRLYGESIIALTQAIQKDPSRKEIYLERAFAHFELGNFDLALQDYWTFGPMEQRGSLESEYLEFALSFQKGIKDRLITGCLDFIPSMLHSLKGVANGIWAVVTDPIETPRQTILSALEFCSFLSQASFFEITGTLAPETHSLVLDWNQLNYAEQGERLGNLIGSFGIDILQVFAINKGAQVFTAYQKLKNANKLAALESLSKDAQKTIAACETFTQNRQKLLSKLKINKDLQGKHIKGRHNYEPGRSIFEHKDPQGLLEKFAGTGRKGGHTKIGNPGYKEKVNFGEYIGKYINEKTGVETPTTWGMIHYSKTSAHIIPVLPDPPQ